MRRQFTVSSSRFTVPASERRASVYALWNSFDGAQRESGHDYSRAVTLLKRLRALAPALLLLLAIGAFAQNRTAPPQSQAIVLKGGKLLTVSHGTIENGVVVMQGGKIIAV